MSILMSTDGSDVPTAGQATLFGSYSNGCGQARVVFGWGFGAITEFTDTQSFTDLSRSYQATISGLPPDRIVSFQAQGNDLTCPGSHNDGILILKTLASAPTIGNPSSTGTTQTTISVSTTWNPTTTDSSANLYIKWRVTGSGAAYQQALVVAGASGSGSRSDPYTITGLIPGTSYDIFANVIRNTSSFQDASSSVVPISTLAWSLTATTDPASSVSTTIATLNGTITPNSATSTDTITPRFDWGLTISYGNSVGLSPQLVGSAPFSLSTVLNGLTANTTYHFRVAVTNNTTGNTATGSDLTFLTSPADPTVFVF